MMSNKERLLPLPHVSFRTGRMIPAPQDLAADKRLAVFAFQPENYRPVGLPSGGFAL